MVGVRVVGGGRCGASFLLRSILGSRLSCVPGIQFPFIRLDSDWGIYRRAPDPKANDDRDGRAGSAGRNCVASRGAVP